jgi:hypothetical protein
VIQSLVIENIKIKKIGNIWGNSALRKRHIAVAIIEVVALNISWLLIQIIIPTGLT